MIYNFDKLMFNILTIKKIRHTNGLFDVNGLPFSAISFRLSGSCEFKIDENRYSAKVGDISFMPENLTYNAKYSNCEYIVVNLSDCNYKTFENISLKNTQFMKDSFNELFEDWEKNHNVNRAKSAIYKILQYIEDEKSPEMGDNDFMKCMDYITANFKDCDFTVEKLCAMAYISNSTLLRKFRQYYNTTPKQYLLNLRLNKAIELLMAGEYSVKRISEMCGFKDEKYFSRIFKKKYNCTPSRFYKSSSI